MQKNLEGAVIPETALPPTKRGLHWVFENLIVYSGEDLEEGFHNCLSLHNRQGTHGVGTRMGHFLGVYAGEVPDLDPIAGCMVLYQWITVDPKIEKRKAIKKLLRRHPTLRQDLQRNAVRINGDVVRDRGGKAVLTQKLKTLDRFK